MGKILIPVLALAGAAYAMFTVAMGSKPAQVAKPVADPSRPPFETYIAGSGIIEAVGQNVAIGSPLPRLALEVHVKVGDDVDAGAPLFTLDNRDLKAELEVRRTTLRSAKARLERLQSSPRPEEVPPAEARVAAAEAQLADFK